MMGSRGCKGGDEFDALCRGSRRMMRFKPDIVKFSKNASSGTVSGAQALIALK